MPSLPTAEELLVTDLAAVEPAYADFEGKMYAGFLPTDNGGNRVGQMMFWLFKPNVQLHEQSMILWLNGGPGCSSFNCGVLMEICTSWRFLV
jgi:carboxypeptidase C (cathepsin A)